MSALIAAILALLHPHSAVVAVTVAPAPSTTTRPPVTQPKAIPSPARALGAVWACIRAHESGGDYATNTGNGYTGAYQMLPHTWDVAVSGAGWPQYANGRADLAPPAVQDSAAVWLQARYGWGQWSTAAGCGAR